jgi:hypothetical protein
VIIPSVVVLAVGKLNKFAPDPENEPVNEVATTFVLTSSPLFEIDEDSSFGASPQNRIDNLQNNYE